MNWSTRLNLVADYIEENLTAEISIEKAAQIACCSKYHFHRVFFAYFNITFAEYVRKRKLTLAAAELITGQETILKVALKYGYTSPNAFTRAFNKVHGINPSAVKLSHSQLTTYSRATLPPDIIGIEQVDYKIVDKASFKIIGKSKQFSFEDFTKNGQTFWKGYVGSDEYKALSRITNGKPGAITGAPLITAYFPKDKNKLDEFLDVLGIESTSGMNAQAFEVHTIPAATYAEFECTYRGAMKANRYIYGQWFAATGYERDAEKPDVVSYFSMPYRHFSEMGVRWWIPIVKK